MISGRMEKDSNMLLGVTADAPGNPEQGASGSDAGAGSVVREVAFYRSPPSMEHPKFKRRKGQVGRPPVYHDFLVAVGRRLRKFRNRTTPVPRCWHRLSKFPQEVLFLTLAGYSPSYICKVFSDELPMMYPTLSPEGVEYSVKRVMSNARKKLLILDDDLLELLYDFKAGPWAPDAEDWLKEEYWFEEDLEKEAAARKSEVGGPVNPAVEPDSVFAPVGVVGKPDVVPASSVAVAPVAVGSPETVVPVPVPGVDTRSDLEKTREFAAMWALFREMDPGLSAPTAGEIVRGLSVGAAVVLAERSLAPVVEPGPVVPAVAGVPVVDAVTPAVEPVVKVPDRFTDAELVPMHRAACKFFGKRPDLKAAEFARCRQIGYFEALMEFEHRDTFADFEWEVTPEGVFTRLDVEEAKPDEILGLHREGKEETLENSLISQGVAEEVDFSAESGESASEEVVSRVSVTSEEVPVVEAVLDPEVCDWEVRDESYNFLLKREPVPVTTEDVRTFVPIMEGDSYEERFSNWQNYQGDTDGMNLFTCDRERFEMLPNMGVTFEQVYGRMTPNLYVPVLMFEEILEKVYGLDSRTVTSSGKRVQHYANVWNRETALEMAPFYHNDWFLPLNPMRVESRRPRTKEEVPVGYTWVPFLGLMETSVVEECKARMLRGRTFEYESEQIKSLHKRFAQKVHQAVLGRGASNVSRLVYAGVADLGASIQFPLGWDPTRMSKLRHPDLAGSPVWRRSGCPRTEEVIQMLSKIRTHIDPGDINRVCGGPHAEMCKAFRKSLMM